VIDGHLRQKLAGHENIPVVVTDLTEDEARKLLASYDSVGAMAGSDKDALKALLEKLSANASEGFKSVIDSIASTYRVSLVSTGKTDPDEVPPPPKVAVTKPGDVWTLGNHRLICGDATHNADVLTVLDGEAAALLLTDPPYNVAYEGGTKEKLSISNDEMNEVAFRQFLVAALDNAAKSLAPGGAYYVWHADSHGLTVRQAANDAGLTVRQCLVWVKSSLVMGRQDYQWKHEPCLYGWKDGGAHEWFSDRAQTTVLDFDKPTKNDAHPTMKPTALFAYLLGNSCPKGGIVLDPFVGSGTTIIAAEQLGMRARVMELEPRYVDVCVERWEKFTGSKATRRKP
jgi:site-specific DNA-methyltransferase (adenine-specific)